MDDEGYEPPVGNMKDWDKNREWYDGYKKAFIDFQDPALGDCPLFPLYKIITKKVFRMIDYFSSFAPGWLGPGWREQQQHYWISDAVPVSDPLMSCAKLREARGQHTTPVWRLGFMF